MGAQTHLSFDGGDTGCGSAQNHHADWNHYEFARNICHGVGAYRVGAGRTSLQIRSWGVGMRVVSLVVLH